MLSVIKSLFSASHDSSEGRPAGASSHETAHPTPNNDSHATPTHQPYEKSSMATVVSTTRVPFGKSVEKFFNDTPEHALEITSDEDTNPHFSTTCVNDTSLTPGLGLGRKDRKRSTSASLGTRRLGGLTRRKKDETIIPDPMVAEMERRKQPFVARGLKPVDTLNAPPPSTSSSRNNYATQNVARKIHRGRKESSASKSAMRENDHVVPIKKPRTGPSPKDGKRERPIELDDSQDQEFNGFDDDIEKLPGSPAPVQPTRRKAQFKAVEGPTVQRKNRDHSTSTRPKAHRDPVPENPRGKQAQKSAQRAYSQLSSDDSLMGEQLNGYNNNYDGVDFVLEVPRQRKTAHSPLTQKPAARNTNYPKFQDPGLLPHGRRSTSLETSRPSEADSPDPIQQSGTNQRSGKQPDRTPLTQKSPSTLADMITGNSNSTKLTRGPTKSLASGHRNRRSCSSEEAHLSMFSVKDVVGYHIIRKKDFYVFCIDLDTGKFWFDNLNSQLKSDSVDLGSITTPRAVGDICSIWYGDTRGKALLKLSRSSSLSSDDFVIELGSHKTVIELTQVLQSIDGEVKVVNRHDDWLDSAFEHKLQDFEETAGNRDAGTTNRRETGSTNLNSEYFDPKGSKPKRPKLVERLDAPGESMSKPTVIGPALRRTAAREVLGELSLVPDPSDESQQDGEAGKGIIKSRYFQQQFTRSGTLRSAKHTESSNVRTPPPTSRYSQRVGLGPKWENDLVYPRDGKKRETVEFGDLFRLDEDEFLNDVLIGFFARYLQQQVEEQNAELLKKMHFFNTYFFDTLTKKSKGMKDINHSAVARWTKTINIFSRDFVVVPVNDNLHWYLAIICNLSYFDPTKRQIEEGLVQDEEDPNDSVQVVDHKRALPKDGDAQDAGQGQRTQQARKSFQNLSLDDESDAVPSSQPEPNLSSQTANGSPAAKSKAGKKKRGKPRKSLPKYDTELPIIITLDSLAQPRSAAISALKQYIVLEAKEKKGVQIEKEDIKGMTAKGIPSQGNYSDCGLYMCMYLEQFMADPYGFVRKILQREEGELRWPKIIRSENLRARLRDLVTELHHQQEKGQPHKDIPPLGKIMVEMREPSPEVISSTPPPLPPRSRTNSSSLDKQAERNFEDARKLLEHVENEKRIGGQILNSQGHLVLEGEARPTSSSSQKRSLEETVRLVDKDPHIPSNLHDPIVLGDDSLRKNTKRLKRKPGMGTTENPPFKKQCPPNQHIRFSSEDLKQPTAKIEHSTPQELADQLREARGSPAQRTRAKTSSPAKRHVRSDSASTDFLSGIDSYATGEHADERAVHTTEKADGDSGLDSEVPETQEYDIEDLVRRDSVKLKAGGRQGASQESEMLL